MPMPRKSTHGVSKKTSFTLKPEILQRLDAYQEALRLPSRSQAIEWALESIDYVLEELGPDRANAMLATEARPRGASVAQQIVALAQAGLWRREHPPGQPPPDGPEEPPRHPPTKRR